MRLTGMVLTFTGVGFFVLTLVLQAVAPTAAVVAWIPALLLLVVGGVLWVVGRGQHNAHRATGDASGGR